jgi:hypothetical protein
LFIGLAKRSAQMNFPFMVRLTTVVTLIVAVSSPVSAVEVCYDYVSYRLTRQDPNPEGSGIHYLDRSTLVDKVLKADKGYAPLPQQPSGKNLKPGDVIFLPGHVGYADGPDRIDHFLQFEGANSAKKAVFNAATLPAHNVVRGGLYRGDSLAQFLARPYRAANGYEVWRRCEEWDISGDWIITQGNGYAPTFSLSQNGTQLTGHGTYPGVTGPLNGTLIGDKFNVLVSWSNNTRGRYVGSMKAGFISDGQGYDETHPTSRAAWKGKGAARCVKFWA